MKAHHPNSHLAEAARYALFSRQLDEAESVWREAFERLDEDYAGPRSGRRRVA